jgi:NAD-dependent deacetylase
MMDDRLNEKIDRLRSALDRAPAVCVLTGAGASAESGVPVYRGSKGIAEALSAADVATPEAFAGDPERVWAWYNDRRRQLAEIRPNAGHLALARLQQRIDAAGADRFHLVTQNVDGLHQAAGSRDVIELHGNLWKTRCTACGQVADATGRLFDGVPRCPQCSAPSRPHVVWFGEMLPQEVWARALRAASGSEVFMAVGTSAVVQPAASLVHVAADAGATTVEINPEATANTPWVDVSLVGKSGDILPRLVP